MHWQKIEMIMNASIQGQMYQTLYSSGRKLLSNSETSKRKES